MEFPVKKKWSGLGYQVEIMFNDYYSGTNEFGQEVALTVPATDYRWVTVVDKQVNIKNENINLQEVVEELQESKYTCDNSGATSAHSIQQEREEDYGDAQESFESIADFWENYLNRKTGLDFTIDAIDVALMMVLFKISRNAYKRKEDNFVDGESYANFATRFFEEQ